jgi:hypothetical protein
MYVIRRQGDTYIVIESEHTNTSDCISATVASGLDKFQAICLLHFLNGGKSVPLGHIKALLNY